MPISMLYTSVFARSFMQIQFDGPIDCRNCHRSNKRQLRVPLMNTRFLPSSEFHVAFHVQWGGGLTTRPLGPITCKTHASKSRARSRASVSPSDVGRWVRPHTMLDSSWISDPKEVRPPRRLSGFSSAAVPDSCWGSSVHMLHSNVSAVNYSLSFDRLQRTALRTVVNV